MVGVGVGFALNAIDDHFHLADKLRSMLSVAARDIKADAQAASAEVRQVPAQLQEAGEGLINRAFNGMCAFLGHLVRAAEEQATGYVWKKVNGLRWYLLPQT